MKLKIVTKKCYVCGEEKPLLQFTTYKDRKGNRAFNNRCKTCANEYKKNHYKNNKEPYLERSKSQREKDPEAYKAYQKEYYESNKERLVEQSKEYYHNNQKMVRNRVNTWRRKPENRLKDNTRKITLTAINKGELVRPKECSICGKECFVEAHHPDYNKPLDVVWVCKSCHENIHHLNEGDISKE